MLSLRTFLQVPVFADEEKSRHARILHTLLLYVSMALGGVGTLGTLFVFPEKIVPGLSIAVAAIVVAVAYQLNRRGKVAVASRLVMVMYWLIVTILISLSQGMRSLDIMFYVSGTVLAGLLLGAQGAFIFAGLSILTGLVMVGLGNAGLVIFPNLFPFPDRSGLVLLAMNLIFTVIPLNLTLSILTESLARARAELAERRRAEAALQRSEGIYRQAIMAAGAVPYYRDYRTNAYTFMGDGILKMTGYSPAEMSPAVWGTLELEGVPRGALAHLSYAEADRLTEEDFSVLWECDYRIRTRAGQTRWVADTSVKELNERGERVGVVGILQDITERKQAEEALRAQEELYRLISTISADYVFSTQLEADGQLCLEWVGGGFEAITGYSFDEYVARGGWLAALHPDDRQADAADIAALQKNQKVISEVRTIHKNGEVRWVQVYAHPLWDAEHAQLTGIYGAVQDITERKQAEFLAQRQLQELTLLHKVATTIVAVETEDQLLERLTDIIGSNFYPTNFGVLLVDPATHHLNVHRTYRGAAMPMFGNIPIGQGVVGQVAATGQARRVADVRSEASVYPLVPNTVSELCVPVSMSGKILGVINTESERLAAFSDSDERLLLTIAGQLATALERLQAEAARRSTNARLEILHSIDTALLSTQAPAEIAQSAADKVRQLMECQHVSVSLFDLPADQVHYLAVSDRFATDLLANSTISREAFGPGIVAALQQGLVKIVEDVRPTGPRPERGPWQALVGFPAWAHVPLIYQGNLIGALNLGSSQPNAFTTSLIDIAREVANQLVIALHQAQLNSDIAEALVREQRLNGVATTISGVLDLPNLLAEIVQLASELVGAESGSLSLAEPGQQTMTDVYAFNVPPLVNGQTLRRGQGLTWQVFEEGQSLLLNDYDRHPQALPEWVAAGLKRYIGVPIIASDVRLGTLGLYKLGQGRPFSTRDLAVAESVGRQAGVAIQNARLVSALEQELAEHARAEQALLENKQTLRALLDASLDIEFLIDTQGRFLELNQTFARSLNRNSADLVGTQAFDLLPPELAAARRTLIDQAIRERKAIRFEDRTANAWLDNSIVPVVDDQGEVSRLAIFARDITEQKQAAAALRNRDVILEAIAFAAQQFLKTSDWQSTITTVLAQLGEGTGVSHVYIFENHPGPAGEALTSQRFEWAAPGVVPDLDNPTFQNMPIWTEGFGRWANALSQGDPFYGSLATFSETEAGYLVPRGIKSLLDVPIMVDGVWWGIIGFDDFVNERDWSMVEVDALKVAASTLAATIQRERTDEQIRRLNADLERRVVERTADLQAANQELEAFSYSISHDLRMPLRGINGFTRILAEDYAPQLDSEAQGYLARVLASTQRMNQLIDDLLAFSRLSRQPLRKQTIQPTALAQQVLEELRPEGGKALEFVVGELPACEADPALLRQVLLNLLSNALKYSRNREIARVEIGWQAGAYFVRDNGAGFDMQYAGKLFGVFQRLHTEREFEGVGAGLATVKRIVERHGGRIWAEAEVDRGATFYFTLAPAPA